MKRITLVLFVALMLLITGSASDARYRFLSPAEMIQNAEVIAVVRINSVEERETTCGQMTYTQRAQAKVEQAIKGNPGKNLILIGKLKERLCVPDWTLEAGEKLVFVRREPGGNYLSANSGVGCIPVKNNIVSWFSNLGSLEQRVDIPLAKAVASIKECLASGNAKNPR